MERCSTAITVQTAKRSFCTNPEAATAALHLSLDAAAVAVGGNSRFTVLKLTAEQSAQVRALLNGDAVFGELRLANLPGEQSEPHIFLGALSPKTATRIRKLLVEDAPTRPDTQL